MIATPTAHPGPLLHGSFSMYEADRLDGSFNVTPKLVGGVDTTPVPSGTTCGMYASGNGGAFAAPVFDTKVGNYAVFFQLLLRAYHGPRTYASLTNSTADGTVAIDVEGSVSIYRARIGGTTTLTVKPDGSGRVDFSTWGSDEVRGTTGSAAAVSGTITWTCS